MRSECPTAGNSIERGLEMLRRKQAERVMPRVGALLDAWEGTSNDKKAFFKNSSHIFVLSLRNLSRVVEGD